MSFPDSEDERKAKRPDAVKTGQVWKMPHLHLDVGAGPEGSTVVSSNEKQVKLPMGTVLILLPESAALAPLTPAELAANAKAANVRSISAPKRVPAPPIPELAACSAPACTVAPSAASAAEPRPLETISLAKTGYRRLRSAEMRDLEFGAATAFLGDDHLLFTFDPHTLIPRQGSDRPEDHPHMVRAIIFSLKSGKAERTVEWRVHSGDQYLWVVDGNHVVVHDGDRLRWFGRSLHEERELKLDGPLAFLRLSPDRRHYAVGTIHELHTKDEHADLAKNDSNGPEEQVAVQILDDHLKTIDDGTQSSRALPPVLLNDGRVELRRTSNGHWYLREYPWAAIASQTAVASQAAVLSQAALASQTAPTAAQPQPPPVPTHRDFARMSSACMPRLQSLANGLITAELCDGSLDHTFRVFRENGQPVLKGVVHWREFSPLTAEDAGSGLFALAMAEAGGTYVRDSTFHGADLERETIHVHRAGDGRPVFETRMRFPLPANQPIALSPGGDRLAVIDGDQIDLYSTANSTAPSVAQR